MLVVAGAVGAAGASASPPLCIFLTADVDLALKVGNEFAIVDRFDL